MWKSRVSLVIFSVLIVGCGVFSYVWLSSRPTPCPQVYDCFLFFNEIELLKVRLEEMAPYVDHFVIVEANETFRGAPKGLNFAENRSLFEPFQDKIIYVPLTEHFESDSPWDRERFQRGQVMRALRQHCHKEDIVLLSDLDEIVRGSCIPEIVSVLSAKQAEAVVCEQRMYYGYLNRYWGQWPGTVASTYQRAKQLGMTKMRKLRNRRPRSLRRMGIKVAPLLADAGWHFTSMGGLQRCIQKVEAYSHQEFDYPEWKTEMQFRERVKEKALVPIDASFPSCIHNHISYFEGIGFIDRG